MKKFKVLLHYLGKYKYQYVFALLTTVATNYIAVTIPDYIEEGVEALNSMAGGGMRALVSPVLTILGLTAVLMCVRILSRALFYNSSRAIECDIKSDMLDRLMHLGRGYYEKNPAGAVISRVNNDITGVRLLCGFGFLQVVNLVSALSLTPYKMWLISPSLTFYCTAAVIFVFAFLRLGMRILFSKIRRQADILRGLSGYISSVLGAMDVIKNFDMRRWSQKEFRRRNKDWILETLGITAYRSFLNPVLGNLEHLLKILVLAAGGVLVMRENLSLGELTAFLAYVGILTAPLMGLSWLMNMLQQGLVGLQSVSVVLNEKPAYSSAPDAPVPSFERALTVKDLGYRYPDAAEDALQGVSFELKPGETLGVLGAVGSGKTTLVNCLNRYLDAGEGKIFLDGEDTSRLSIPSVRKAIRTVSQEAFLFSDTVRDNICFLSGAFLDEEELSSVLRAAALEEEAARFPSGVETVVGERGIMLSGGQKQRISLARALAGYSPILILDDVLSAVDYETERKLLGSIYGFSEARSLIIVSHRVKALQKAHKILVLEKGKVTDQGTHEELLGRPGYYRSTWELQNLLEHHPDRSEPAGPGAEKRDGL